MYDPIFLWAGFAILLLLLLPFSGTRKLILELSTWGVRLALLALLVGGAILWFRPEWLPAEAAAVVGASPELQAILPAPGTQTFGLAAALLAGVVLLPVLAMLDVTRALAGDRLRRLRKLADATRPAATLPEEGAAPATPGRSLGRPGPVQRRPDRRAAAETLAEIGSRKPYRVSDNLP
jgi:hypothetical protein